MADTHTITGDRNRSAWAAATDAANRSMRAAGRTAWAEDDYNAGLRELRRLAAQDDAAKAEAGA